MKYILLIYGDEREWTSLSKEEMDKVYAEHGAYGQALQAAGIEFSGYELKPVASATSVKSAKGQARTVDGPFAETKEQLAGYYVVDVPTLDDALAWARRMPGMTEGTVEVRPLAVDAGDHG
jgi:hypothetical protein